MSFLRDRHFIFNFWILVLIAVLHNSASFFYFYWTIWWFDILMHFLGGFWISSVCLWLLFGTGLERFLGERTRGKILVVSLLSAVVLGLAWEVFELLTDIILFPEYIPDSSLDMVMDTIGGFFAYIYYWRSLKSKNG